MLTHAQFVFIAYALTFLVLAGLGLWLWFDRKARLAELNKLEQAGIRRRSKE